MSCPSGFEAGLGNSCHVQCPDGYKYIQSGGEEQCVFKEDNRFKIHLQAFSFNANRQTFLDEQGRFHTELDRMTSQIQTQRSMQSSLEQLKENGTQLVEDHERIQSQSANLDDVLSALKPLRPPTQPQEDVSVAKQKIIMSEENMLLIQIALFTVFLCLTVYLTMPTPFSHYVSILILSVGIATGIYLGKV